ncbi:MAG: M14 family zinc carboxypeptidase [Eubacteriales bacterium]|nr:M14 family zinc carboxypeptidase [Eubacteriales bacterium]
MRKRFFLGALTVFMTVSSSFISFGDVTFTAPGESAALLEEPEAAPEAETYASSPVIDGTSRNPGPGAASGASGGSASGGSSVITAGGSLGGGPGVTGPGAGSAVISKGLDGFAGTVQSPIVTVKEKYTYDQMSRDIQELSARYSHLMQVNTIGTTWDGRSIYEIVVGNPSAEKHVLIHAGIHAREYMTPLLVMKQLEYGLFFYGSGSYEGRPLSDMFNQVAVHYVPMVNPDGISISQSGTNGIRSEELRRTIEQCYNNDVSLGRTSAAFNSYLNYWKSNGRGVDLNQNFPADWDQVTTSSLPSYATYKGDSPLSEPESQALANLLNSRTWSATISYHSMGNIIYWDYQGNKVSDLSLNLANTVSARTGYRLAGASGHGGFKDWAQIKDNPVPSLTLEVGSVACPMPLTEFTDVWNRNNDVWALVMKWALEH